MEVVNFLRAVKERAEILEENYTLSHLDSFCSWVIWVLSLYPQLKIVCRHYSFWSSFTTLRDIASGSDTQTNGEFFIKNFVSLFDWVIPEFKYRSEVDVEPVEPEKKRQRTG